ncbi:MAG: dihydropyrimidinase [Lachnospirales bacterium]
MNLLIKNGKIVLEDKVINGDILVENGKIKDIGNFVTDCKSIKTIDASGNFVFPGLIDVHTHFNIDVGIAKSVDNFYTGTLAAAVGGTTTIVDHMGFGPKGCNLSHQLDVYLEYAKDSCIDYGFHGVVQHIDDEVLKDMENLIERGLTSYKIYLTYDYKLSDYEVLKILERAKELNLIVCVHPEIDGVIHFFKDKFVSDGNLSPIYHEKARPFAVESEAISKMASFSYMLGDVPLYIVHLSNEQGLFEVNKWRDRGLSNIFVETCPQYLFLDESKYLEDDGIKYILSPPLRNKSNNQPLLNGLNNGDIQCVGTDHCSFDYLGDKQLGKDNFTKCPNGMSGVETRGILMFSEVVKGNLDIHSFVNTCSTNPAKLFGLDKKGVIKVGNDADLVIASNIGKSRIKHSSLHENVDYTPYENIEVYGKFLYTISRGEIVAKDNNFVGKKGYGKYINRSLSNYNKV